MIDAPLLRFINDLLARERITAEDVKHLYVISWPTASPPALWLMLFSLSIGPSRLIRSGPTFSHRQSWTLQCGVYARPA